MIQRNFKVMRFSRSFCLLLTEYFLSIRTEISVRSLPLCQILQIFTVNFQRYFRSKYKFCKIFEGTRSLNLHPREPGMLAQERAISGPGHARQETISSRLKRVKYCTYMCKGSLIIFLPRLTIVRKEPKFGIKIHHVAIWKHKLLLSFLLSTKDDVDLLSGHW